MQDHSEESTHGAANKAVFVSDADMARMLGVSPQFLQKDRVTAKRIPFVRLGDRCLYEPEVVLATVRAMATGGDQPNRARMARKRRVVATFGPSSDR
jgi:hypothetical protein